MYLSRHTSTTRVYLLRISVTHVYRDASMIWSISISILILLVEKKNFENDINTDCRILVGIVDMQKRAIKKDNATRRLGC
jgi:hypothetical protein